MAFLPTLVTDLPLVLQLLQALGLAKNVPADTAGRIATIVADLTKLAQDGKDPSLSDVHDVLKLLQDLKDAGFISGSVVDGAIGNLTKFQAVAADYTSGQVALLDSHFSFAGIEGDLFAISKTSPVRASLGL